MKLFTCDGCGELVYFENAQCLSCQRLLGYDARRRRMVALDQADGRLIPTMGGEPVRYCANASWDACNWVLPEDSTDQVCRCCRHNRTVPDLSDARNVDLWRRLEKSKHRLVDSLIALKLPMPTRQEEPASGLAFDFLDPDLPGPGGESEVRTGHADGVVTVVLPEADDAVRERIRLEMGEPYRSTLGHLRHEVGHFYFDRLVVPDPAVTDACRQLFGDERADYAEALKRHYADGPPVDWGEHHVSAYATAHAWEDFAETFAHYLHIMDTMETAHSFGIAVRPRVANAEAASMRTDSDPREETDFEVLVSRWLPLTYALNSLNRSMGQNDFYPFVLPPPVIQKLGFIHGLVMDQRQQAQQMAA